MTRRHTVLEELVPEERVHRHLRPYPDDSSDDFLVALVLGVRGIELFGYLFVTRMRLFESTTRC